MMTDMLVYRKMGAMPGKSAQEGGDA
jgi:hypothetical protein